MVRKLVYSLACAAAGLTTAALPAGSAMAEYVAESVGKAQAAEKARAKHGGKVLDVSEKVRDGKKVYRVKLLLDGGKVIYVTVDGGNGRVS